MSSRATLTLPSGITVHYWTYNPEAPVTMVLVHGFTGSHEGFQYIIPLLPDIQFIVPDLPGFGTSELPPESDWTIDSLARLANEFTHALQLERPPHVLGHSMGGLVVSSMLDQSPELYHPRATLLSPVPTAIGTNDPRRGGAILGALQYGIGYRVPGVGPRLVKSRLISKAVTKLIMTTNDQQLRQEIYAHHINNLEYLSNIQFYDKIHRDINRRGAINYTETLKQFEILLISGDTDSVTPIEEMDKLARAITPAQFIVLPGVGHLAHYERASDVADAVRDFLEQS